MFIIQTIILGLCLGFVYALMATGLTLPIFGVMRIVNLAHPIFILVGAFAAAYYLFVIFGMDPIFAIPLCAATTAILGAITYKIMVKDAGSQTYSEMTVLLTFGTAMVLDGTLSYLFKNTQRITSPRMQLTQFLLVIFFYQLHNYIQD